MMKEETLRTLFIELHREIDMATQVGLNNIGSLQRDIVVTYPPGTKLTEEEKLALGSLRLSTAARSALKKIMTDVASAPLYRLFLLVDGVSDPDDCEIWSGLKFVEKGLEPEEEEVMLHDEFYGSYWDYQPG